MFKLFRHISSSIYPRLDHPWSDDATSNAPTIGRKRRMSDEDEDARESGSTRKRRAHCERQDTSELGELLGVKGSNGSETDPSVKEVTRGVKVVELEDHREPDDGKVAEEEASNTVDGESSDEAPLDPTHAPQNVDGPSQDVVVTDDKVPPGQQEAIAEAEAPSNDPPEVEEPTSTDIGEPLTQSEKEEAPLDATPETKSGEIADAVEPLELEA